MDRAAFLSTVTSLKPIPHTLPDGQQVYIRKLSQADLAWMRSQKDLTTAECYILRSVCDENGNRLLADDDAGPLSGISFEAALSLYDAIRVHSGIGGQDSPKGSPPTSEPPTA